MEILIVIALVIAAFILVNNPVKPQKVERTINQIKIHGLIKHNNVPKVMSLIEYAGADVKYLDSTEGVYISTSAFTVFNLGDDDELLSLIENATIERSSYTC